MHFLNSGRWGYFLVVCAAVASCLSAGCDGGNPGGPDTSILPDGGMMSTAVLEVVGDPNLALLFGEEAPVRIVYREMDGSPISGATVELALVGRANDSSLSELTIVTEPDGEAGFRVMGGTTASAFSVRVSAPRAAPILVGVSVSDAGFGGLRVSVEWMGSRRVETRRVAVFTGMTCDDADVLEGEADREKTLLETDPFAEFLALPAGLVYAVTATGLGPMGDAVAWGCADEVLIEADLDTEANVLMTDLPLDAMGTYATLVDIDSAVVADAVSRAAPRGGRSLVETAGGDASFFLDRIEDHLRGSGSVAAADLLAARRSSAFLDDALSSALMADGSGPSRAIDALSGELSLRAQRLAIDGWVSLDATDPAFEVISISARDAASAMPTLVVDLGALGPTSGRLVFTAMPEDDAISIDELGATIPLGALGLALTDAIVYEAGPGDLGGLLETRGGCTALATWTATEPDIDGACDAACVTSVCQTALEDVATAIQTELATLNLQRSELSLSGLVDARDEAGDLTVDVFSSDDMTGRYESSDGVEYDEVSATVRGDRLIE